MASIGSIGTGALLAFQRAMSTTGNNIANVNTEGYSRQRVGFTTQPPEFLGGSWLGAGVKANAVERIYDNFLAGQVRSSQSATSNLETIYRHASRIDNLLARPESGLDATLQGFFDSLQGMADTPASIAARQEVLSDSRSLVDRFNYLGRQYSDMRENANQELRDKVSALNGYADSIAQLNQAIVTGGGAAGGLMPNDLLDQRENLFKEVAKLVDIAIVEQDDGAANVFIGKGQALVIGGNATSLSLTSNPADTRSPDISINTMTGSQVITSQMSGGELSGLLEFRSDFLDSGQNMLGQTAVNLISSINAQHNLGIDLLGTQGGDYFQPLTVQGQQNQNNAGTGVVSLTFDDATISDVTTSDYELLSVDGVNYTLTRLSDNTVTGPFAGASPPTIDGLNLTITAGAAAGDTFLIQPTRQAAEQITFLIDNPSRLAAAGSLHAGEVTDANGNPLNTGDATITQPNIATTTGIPIGLPNMNFIYTNNAGGTGNPGFDITNGPAGPNDFILYDPSTADIYGKSFPDGTIANQFSLFGDLTFEIAGTPAVGDQFEMGDNTAGQSDNRNALDLANIQSLRLVAGGSASLQESYSQLVSDVGSRTHYADINYQAQEGLLQSNEATLSSQSGVNLDEEAANLVKYQQGYQAAAQVISVSSTLFDTLLSAVRR